MKILMIVSLMVLISCNKAPSSPSVSGGSDDTESEALEIAFESHNFFVNTGWTSQEYTVDEQRSLIIPEFIYLTEDTNASVANNNIARIKFVDSNCDYRWNGTSFVFDQCYGALASAQYGDQVYLHDLTGFGNAALAGKINIGLFRASPAHTGNIIIQATL